MFAINDQAIACAFVPAQQPFDAASPAVQVPAAAIRTIPLRECNMENDPLNSPPDRSPAKVVHQSGVVAFRWNGVQPEYCLITSRRSKRWGFPKGRISQQVTMKAAALQEAVDEAGVEGMIIGEPLSQYVFKKRGKRHEVLVYLLQVQKCNHQWKESGERTRQWVSLEKARELIDRSRLTRLLDAAAARIATLDPGLSPALFPNLQMDGSQVSSFPVRRR
jgi:ADP-ribose pyrophosphatase YjhB (NUDIX family)